MSLVWFLPRGNVSIDGGRNNLAGNSRPRDEAIMKLDPEPTPELPGVANRTPHPLARRPQQNFLLNPIGVRTHMQPPSCIYSSGTRIEAQPSGCQFRVVRSDLRPRICRQSSPLAPGEVDASPPSVG